jgi:phosphoribosylformylglycinamidine synthase I
MRGRPVRVGVVTFPGSNGDRDMRDAVESIDGLVAVPLWHAEEDLRACSAVILPGGFSYGDRVRAGAIARSCRIMDGVRAFARRGGPVLGVCNGFQILCEGGLLPGLLGLNRDGRFRCATVPVRLEGRSTPFTEGAKPSLRLPIAHGTGRWHADPEVCRAVEGEGQVVMRYEEDTNGSFGRIAGVCNAAGNVVGVMPHPERACDPLLGSVDGRTFFETLLARVA